MAQRPALLSTPTTTTPIAHPPKLWPDHPRPPCCPPAQGISAAAQGLAHNCGLQQLLLSNCRARAQGAIAVAEALVAQQQLRGRESAFTAGANRQWGLQVREAAAAGKHRLRRGPP